MKSSPLDDKRSYGRFWTEVGESFPDLGGAASTAYYRDNEALLFETFLPELDGLRVLKTDGRPRKHEDEVCREPHGRWQYSISPHETQPAVGS